jgi:hypothetical protein
LKYRQFEQSALRRQSAWRDVVIRQLTSRAFRRIFARATLERDNCVSQFPAIPCYVTERRFPAPWTAEEYRGISYIVRDANNFPVAYIYFDTEPGRRSAANMMTKDEARGIAAGIAKMPELLGKLRRTKMSSAS